MDERTAALEALARIAELARFVATNRLTGEPIETIDWPNDDMRDEFASLCTPKTLLEIAEIVVCQEAEISARQTVMGRMIESRRSR